MKLTKIVFFTLVAWMNLAAADAVKVYEQVSASVYFLNAITQRDEKEFTGSAVAIAPHLLATNCHVALSSDRTVVLDKNKPYPTKVVYQDQKQDLCLLWVSDLQLKTVKLRKSSDVKIGEKVYAIGNPHEMNRTVSEGLLSNKIPFDVGTILVTSAVIAPGSSGGGLFDENGNLLGLTTQKDAEGGYGYALPSEWIEEQISRHLPINGEAPKAISKPEPDLKSPSQSIGVRARPENKPSFKDKDDSYPLNPIRQR